jgi:hypothetical protein
VVGGLLAAGGLFMMSFLDLDSGFWSLAFPAQLLLGLGLGFTFVPLANLALIGAGEHDAGAASAMLNATQQVGASVGTALLATLSVGAISDYISDITARWQTEAAQGNPPDAAAQAQAQLQAQVEGYTTAFTWAAVLLLLGALVSAFLIKATREDLPADGQTMAHVG